MPPFIFIKDSVLYLVSTPIGNLKDFSFRALDILKECDYILCEDTRHSQNLLNHYSIKKLLEYIEFQKPRQMRIDGGED